MIQTLIKKFRRNRSGFTLIELIVVIAILGILAAVLIPTVTNVVGNAKKQAAQSDCKAAFTSAQLALQDEITAGTTSIKIADKTALSTKIQADVTGTYSKGTVFTGTPITFTDDGTSVNGIASVTVSSNGYTVTYQPGAANGGFTIV